VHDIRAIILDIGGVLEVSPDGKEPAHSFSSVLERWDDRLVGAPGDLATYLAETRTPGSVGDITTQEWHAGLSRLTGGDEPALAALLDDLWAVYLGVLNEELAGWFRGLRPRYRTALLSNSYIGAREREETRYGYSEMTELIVYSHEEGMEKPDRRIYERTCERLALAPEQTVFLDDVDSYVEGARAVGMHAVLYRDNASAIAEIESLLRPSTRA